MTFLEKLKRGESFIEHARRVYKEAIDAAKQREFLRSPEGLASLVVQRKY